MTCTPCKRKEIILIVIKFSQEFSPALFLILFCIFIPSFDTVPMMWFILVVCNVFLATTVSSNTKTTGPTLIKFDEETLNKLRLPSARLLSADSYIDYELLNEYQCAIECVKDQSVCTGYAYDSAVKICSLFGDSNQGIDPEITKIVRFIYL